MLIRSERWQMLVLFIASLLVVGAAAIFEKAPGYMDAEYYFSSAQTIAAGKGFYQPILWNYLDSPTSVQHPSHTYWMPLVSLVAAVGLLFGGEFSAARIPLMLLAALIPPLGMVLGLKLHGRVRTALWGGIFALLPVFYLAYLPTTDSFGLMMLLGGGMAWLTLARERPILRVFLMGVLTGLLHLTRADGLLWLGVVVACAALEGWRSQGSRGERVAWGLAFAMGGFAGYLIPMMVWYARNLILWNQLFPSGGTRALWLTRYEDTFLFPAALLTPQRWLASGWQAIASARLEALGANLQTLVAVQGSIVLFPFILVGLWKMRRQAVVWGGMALWLVFYLLMSIVFPFAGMNGGFFHSGAAFQVLFWAAAPVGIEAAVAWVAKLRRWERGKSVERFLYYLLAIVLVGLSIGMVSQRVGIGGPQAGWNEGSSVYQALDRRLVELGATPCLAVMVNNPAGYYVAAHRPVVVIPFGDQDAVLKAAREYKVSYLILDPGNGWYLADLYSEPKDYPGLHYLASLGSARIYAFTVD